MTNSNASNAPTGINLYSRYAFAGAVCASFTHGVLTPIDVIKTRIQLEPLLYRNGMIQTCRQIISTEGSSALLTGLAPTLAGYFVQGALKFGGYEFWKKTFIDYVGIDTARQHKTAIYVASGAVAEFFADIALCPLEATRIRQVSQPDFGKSMSDVFLRLWREEGMRGMYAGFGPILFKQVPYTVTKFVVFEQVSEWMFRWLNKPKEELTNGMVMAVNMSAGLIGGAASAVTSQPADTLLSKINKQKGVEGSVGKRLYVLARELGVKGLFLGLSTRVVMVGLMAAGQFVIYGDIKRILGATGGVEISKVQKSE